MPGTLRDYVTLGLLFLVLAASALDITTDIGHGAPIAHLVQESLLMICAFGMVVWITRDLRRQTHRVEALQAELETARSQASQRAPQLEQARRRLGEAIDDQFRDWALTESEREVGWLLLKGLSIKEIAAMRATHEKTVRQQASAIYRKADLPGRHAFVAWFIEDLL